MMKKALLIINFYSFRRCQVGFLECFAIVSPAMIRIKKCQRTYTRKTDFGERDMMMSSTSSEFWQFPLWIPADLDNFTIANKPADIKRGATLRLPYVLCQRESKGNFLLTSWWPHKQYLCLKLGVEYEAMIPFYFCVGLGLKKGIIFLPLFIFESLINMVWKIYKKLL